MEGSGPIPAAWPALNGLALIEQRRGEHKAARGLFLEAVKGNPESDFKPDPKPNPTPQPMTPHFLILTPNS